MRIAVYLFIKLLLLAPHAKAIEIEFMLEDLKPWSYENEQGEASGTIIRFINELSNRMDFQPKFVFYPWARSERYLARTDLDSIRAIPGIVRLKSREDRYSWAFPIGPAHYAGLYRLASREELSDIQHEAQMIESDWTLGGIREDFTVEYYEERGKRQIIEVNNHQQLVQMLITNRIDFASFAVPNLNSFTHHSEITPNDLVPIENSLSTLMTWMAFSKNTPESFINEIAQTFEEILEDGTADRLMLEPDLL